MSGQASFGNKSFAARFLGEARGREFSDIVKRKRIRSKGRGEERWRIERFVETGLRRDPKSISVVGLA
jgi:hypothetical protein